MRINITYHHTLSLFCAFALALFIVSAANTSLAAGGLAERRAMAAYQESAFPDQLKAVQASAKFDVPVEVNWDSLVLEGQAESYKEAWYITDVYFSPLAAALNKITADDMGKSALKDKLKKIVISYDAATAPASNYAAGVKFADGVLTLNFKPGENGSPDQVTLRAAAIQELLESKL